MKITMSKSTEMMQRTLNVYQLERGEGEREERERERGGAGREGVLAIL